MTQDTDALSEAIQTALAAAEAATDAASEAAQAVKGQAALSDRLRQAQRRAGLVTMAAVAGALLAIGAAGLVYLRSVADLREAAGLQAAAAGAWVERMTALDEAIAAIASPDFARKADLDALSERLANDMKAARAAAAAATPEAGLARLRDDVLAALSEIDLRLTNMQTGVAPAETTELTTLLKQAIEKIGTAPAVPAARPAVASPAPSRSAAPKPAAPKPASGKPAQRSGAAAPATSPFSYP